MNLKRLFVWLTLFSIAMGFLETSVVVYLRELYYPNGFGFPLVSLEPRIALTELGREAATIVMLAGVGIIAGKNPTQRFAWFIYCFGIWDIFYYVFLKLLLNWPESLLTWDILFLIPILWAGPVLAPCIVSASMILLALVLVRNNEKNVQLGLNTKEWILAATGSMVIILSFIIDSFRHIQAHPGDPMEAVTTYIPTEFNWWIFFAGQSLIFIAIYLFYIRAKRLTLAS